MKPNKLLKTVLPTIFIILLIGIIGTAISMSAASESTNTDKNIDNQINPTHIQKDLDALNQKDQIVNQSASESSISTNSPPWDSPSPSQQSNTRDYVLKVDYIPQTEWTDILGTYSYFDLPISIKLVNSVNSPVGSQKIFIWIYEYKDVGLGYYQYITSYRNSKFTDSGGNVDFIYSFPYRGYFKSMYKVYIYWDDGISRYKENMYNIHVAWYQI